MVIHEDTQDTTFGSEDTHVTVVEPEDNITFVKGRREGETGGRRKNIHVRLQHYAFFSVRHTVISLSLCSIKAVVVWSQTLAHLILTLH